MLWVDLRRLVFRRPFTIRLFGACDNGQPRTPLIQDIIDLFTSVSPDISRSIRMEVASAESKYDCDEDISTIIREVAEAREEERRCFIQ